MKQSDNADRDPARVYETIVLTDGPVKRVDPAEVAAALGAEPITDPDEIARLRRHQGPRSR